MFLTSIAAVSHEAMGHMRGGLLSEGGGQPIPDWCECSGCPHAVVHVRQQTAWTAESGSDPPEETPSALPCGNQYCLNRSQFYS